MECYCLFDFRKIFVVIQAILTFIYGDMASKNKEKRKRVVQFLNRVMTTRVQAQTGGSALQTISCRRGVPNPTVYIRL